MIALALMLAAQTGNLPPCPGGRVKCEPWERQWNSDPIVQPANPFQDLIPKGERLGPGPHTLVVSDGNAITRMDYKSGAACARARDTIRRQVAPPPNTQYVIYGPSPVKAFCVPR